MSLAALAILPAGPAMAAPARPAALHNTITAARPVSADADFLIAVHQGNLAQITVGKLAARKSENPVVRKLGKRFASYHKKLDSQVKAVSRELAVRLPKEANSEQQELTAQYRAASAADFDSLFVTTQLANYERAAKLAGLVLKLDPDPAVRELVENATPVIERNRVALTAARDQLASELPRQ